jgi:hypothetical protein
LSIRGFLRARIISAAFIDAMIQINDVVFPKTGARIAA